MQSPRTPLKRSTTRRPGWLEVGVALANAAPCRALSQEQRRRFGESWAERITFTSLD